jgi:D-alanyl-D-alanine carboxypeptidase
MAVLFAASTVADEADARSRRHRHHHHRSYHRVVRHHDAPRASTYASIVVDVNSGKVLEESNADSPRHPASLTKMMTLYLLFERLEAGKLKLSTELPVSEHAAEQAPSKLELKPGQAIDIDSAIKAIVTKSANDVAVVVAEALGGSEADFAKLMTAKARELGMTQTNYHNASGLPDDRQITTAHDQAILARALQDRFPRYFQYFSTRAFVYRGKAMRNHNHLLGRVNGVNGIKTGYIHDSGFNIVTSVQRGQHRIVAVVFGGPTAGWRDARVRGLIEANIAEASAKRTAPLVVEGWQTLPKFVSAPPAPPVAHLAGAPPPGSSAPIKPNPVKTVTVAPGTVNAAMFAAALPSESHKLERPSAKPAHVNALATIKGAELPPLPPAKPSALAAREVSDEKPSEPAAKPRGPYLIQVGAFDAEAEAKQRLAAAQSKAKELLADANPFTEKVAKGDKSMYRARFAGLEKSQAEAACKNLKRSEIPCFLLKD